VFKIIQDLLAPGSQRGKTQFHQLMGRLPEEHKAKWFAGAAINTSEQAMSSVMSTALSRLNAFLDSELEQILCFDTAIDAEQFCKQKSAIFIVLPEEDTSKHFMVSLIVQQLYREILAVADEHDGRLPNRVMMYLDEFGTIPKIEGAEMMFSASRSRRVSIVAIIQSLAQLQKNYGKEGSEIITDNTQLTVFGGFAPNSESAQVLSKALGFKTVQSGSVSRSKNDPSQSLQMIERALLTPDELKSLPKGTFCVMKTGFYPMQVKLKLFFNWGIVFPKNVYVVPDKGNRAVSYANREILEAAIATMYPSKSKSVGEKMSTEEQAKHAKAHSSKVIHKNKNKSANTGWSVSVMEKDEVAETDADEDDDTEATGDSMPMAQPNLPVGEDIEIIVNREGEIVNERIRNDIP
jgi:type IV secretion system protein VirD4